MKPISVRMPVDVLDQLSFVPTGHRSDYIIAAVREKLAADKQVLIEEGLRSLAFDREANEISWAEMGQLQALKQLD